MKTGFMSLPSQPPVAFGGAEPYPLFTRITFETTSTCTRACGFCAVRNRPTALRLMSDALYTKLCDELAALRWKGVVQWFNCNEPLMDKQILPRLRQLRAAAPGATIHVTSNGDVISKLTVDEAAVKIIEIYEAGCTVFNLNAYDTAEQHARHVAIMTRVHELYPRARWPKSFAVAGKAGGAMWRQYSGTAKILHVQDQRNPTGLHDWQDERIDREQGAIPGRLRRELQGPCGRPSRHIVVLWNGKVIHCCIVDPQQAERPGNTTVVGDANTQSLVEIWNGEGYMRYRWQLQHGRRSRACAGCRERTAFPHVVRRVTADPTITAAWDKEEQGGD